MRQRPMRTLLWMMFMVMAVGMAACSAGPRGTAARPSQHMHAGAALEGRLPEVVRLANADVVTAADAPTPTSPLTDDEVLEDVEEEVFDLYTAVRNAYLQRRQRAIQEGTSPSPSALSGEPDRPAAGASDAR
jgi:hypothetical protein